MFLFHLIPFHSRLIHKENGILVGNLQRQNDSEDSHPRENHNVEFEALSRLVSDGVRIIAKGNRTTEHLSLRSL